MGLKFLQDIVNLDNIQFINSSGTNAGLINMDGNDLVISNSQGDVLLGDGSADVFIGDGTNNVDIRFEQSGSITADNSNATLTIGGTGNLVVEAPTINNPTFSGTFNLGSKLTLSTSNGYILFDYEPAGDTGEYTTEVPLLKIDHNGTEKTILSRISENGGIQLGHDDSILITGGDVGNEIKANWGATDENVVLASEAGFYALAFPNNSTTWSNRNIFRFYGGDGTAANNGLYIGDGGSTQFIDLDRNLKNIGTIDSGAVTVTAEGTATLTLRGDSNNSGDTGELDSTIKMLHDDGTHGILMETKNFAGKQSFEIKSLSAGTESSRLLIHEDNYITIPGALGVGTVSPTYKLDVTGDGIRATRSTAGWAGWFENTGDSSGVVVTAGVDSGDAPLLIRKQDGTELFSVRGDGTSWFKNGNVGVGTSTPNKNFTVEWEDNNASVDTGEGLGGGTAGSGVLLENTSTTANSYANLDFRSNNADGRIAYKYNSINDGDFHFITDNGNSPETKLFIKSSGNVGIGTTSPDSLLEISSSSATDFLKLTSGGGSATPVKLIFEKSGSEQGIIEYNRNGDLEIYNTDGDGGVMIDGSASAGGDLYVNNAGNVGIGTTSPGEKLEVDGNIAVSGTVDGRDIATDGTKLDTVDTNADVTPSWVPSSDPSYLTAHPNISAASSVNNSGKTHIQDITVDSNGHVTGIVSHALTSSDFLEPNSNATLNSLSCGTFTHPTDISFVLDNDNNETASFTIKDGAGNSPFTLTEAGDLTITGKFVSTYAAKASSGDILVEDSGEIKKRTPTELKTDLSLNNVPNTDATNANNLASGTVPTARLATTAIAKGGTGATSASGARAALGAAASSHTHAASDITSGTFDSNRVKQICTTHHNFFMNSSSTTTDFFIPYNNLNESSNPTNSIYYGRMVAPYDGRIVKVVLHTTAAIGTACQVLFWVATSSGTFAPSAAETVTGVNLNTANTSATATFSTTSTAEFDEGDVLGVSIIKSSSATANMQVTVVWEYTV